MSTSLRSIRRSLGRRYYTEKLVTDRHGVTKGIAWRPDGFPLMQSVLKPGKCGDASVTHFTVTEKDADSFNLSLIFSAGSRGQQIDPGKYVRLHVGGSTVDNLMMSDTPMERRSNWEIRRAAHGRVLIAGLGIGMILHPILDPKRTSRRFNAWEQLPSVEHVTVIENNLHVIKLVKPSLERYGGRLEIIHASIFDVDPKVFLTAGNGGKFDTVYFDIWPTCSQDNLPEIAKLHQRWKSRLNRGGPTPPFMSSWQVERLRSLRAEDQRSWRW